LSEISLVPAFQYNPLDKINLGKSVAEALIDRDAEPLGTLPQFAGAGIYAIYYCQRNMRMSPLTAT
jgi:hypothetical protein